jgi:hypothetical protein
MGFYGMTPLLIGQQVKIFLTLFRMLSPTLQDTFIYGAFDATKSFFIGLLLTIFQITAPEEVRAPLIGILEKIARKKAEIDGILIDAELSARADHFAPTFEDFNNIQSLMDDPEFICSTEYEKLIEIINTTSVINMILQILRIPVSKEFRAYRCGTKPSKPFITLLVDQSKKDKEKEKLSEPISNANTQMPISAGQGDGTAPVAEETPQEAAEETPQEASEETPEEETPQETTPVEEEKPAEVVEETPVEEEKPVEAVEEKPEDKPVALHAPIGSKQEKPEEKPAEKPATLHAPTGSAQTQSVKKGGLRQTKKRRVRASSSL